MSYNQPRKLLHHVMDQAGVDYSQALTLLDLYGLIEWLQKEGREPSMRELADDRGTSWRTVRRNVTLMQGLGWLTFTTTDREGTEWTLSGVPMSAEDLGPAVVASAAPAVVASPAPAVVRSADPAVVASAHQELLQEPLQEGKKKNNSSSPLKKKAIEEWNRLKPNNFNSISSISPSRDRSIVALGGYKSFIDQLPAFFAGVKKNKFWGKNAGISFENIIGSGAIPKAHFTELSEAGAGSNQNTTPRSLEHPDFFPPSLLTGDMRPKHGFKSADERKAAEADARVFYSQL